MTDEAKVVEAFCQMSCQEKTDFLVRIGFKLTVVARSAYEAGTENLTHPRWLRSINEVQHRILGYLAALVGDDSRRYPDDVLARIMLEGWGDPALQKAILQICHDILASPPQRNGVPQSR
jgi:hypothetical protein